MSFVAAPGQHPHVMRTRARHPLRRDLQFCIAVLTPSSGCLCSRALACMARVCVCVCVSECLRTVHCKGGGSLHMSPHPLAYGCF